MYNLSMNTIAYRSTDNIRVVPITYIQIRHRTDLKQELIVRTTMASSDLTGSRNSLNSTLGDGAAAAATKTRPATGDQQDVTTIRRLSISSNHSSINNQHNNQQHAPANSVCIGGTNNGIAECKKHSSNVDGAQTMTTTTTTASTIKEAASAASTTPAAAAAHQSQNPIKRKLSLAFRYARRALRRKRTNAPGGSLVRLNELR